MKKLAKFLMIAAMTGACAYAGAEGYSKKNHAMRKSSETTQLRELNRSQVREVQRALSSRGYILSIDGVAGHRTQAAIRKFQRDAGITADGTLNVETLERLNLNENSEFDRLPASRPLKGDTHDSMGRNPMNQDDENYDAVEEPTDDDTDSSEQY